MSEEKNGPETWEQLVARLPILPDSGSPFPWYWNDRVNPFNPEFAGRLEDVLALHRSRDFNPDDLQIARNLSDAHLDLGDEDGAEFWAWVADTDRIPDFFEKTGLWWWDNALVFPNESRFAVPFAATWLMDKGEVLLPEPFRITDQDEKDGISWYDTGDRKGDAYIPGIGFRTRVNSGAKIVEMAFDGRLAAETTLLAAWRKMTAKERAEAKAWNFDYLDSSRDGGSDSRGAK